MSRWAPAAGDCPKLCTDSIELHSWKPEPARAQTLHRSGLIQIAQPLAQVGSRALLTCLALEDALNPRTGVLPVVRRIDLVRPEGFEPSTLGSEDRCAIQLRHGRITEPSLADAVKILKGGNRQLEKP